MAMTTSKTIYRAGYQPLVPGIFVAPFPNAYAYGWDEATTVNFCVRELKRLLKMQTAPQETAAIRHRTCAGRRGIRACPQQLHAQLRQVCDEHDILLVADEVQSGFGRTGKWLGIDHSGIVPDMIVMAKRLASGMPLSGIAAPHHLMDKWPPGSHGGTYGGNAVACAAAVATIQAMRAENLIDNARQMGQLLLTGLRQLQEEHPAIGDVRGRGLMVAAEFTAADGEPWGEKAGAVIKACQQQRLLLLTCGAYGNVVRWIPPLVVNPRTDTSRLEDICRGVKRTKSIKREIMHIWRANVKTQSVIQEPVPEHWQRLGGRGLLAQIMVDELTPTCEPLGPANKLIFAPPACWWDTCSPAATGYLLAAKARSPAASRRATPAAAPDWP